MDEAASACKQAACLDLKEASFRVGCRPPGWKVITTSQTIRLDPLYLHCALHTRALVLHFLQFKAPTPLPFERVRRFIEWINSGRLLRRSIGRYDVTRSFVRNADEALTELA